MISQYVEPCKGSIQSFQITPQSSGTTVELTPYVHVVRVYENICKPYLTGQVIIFDTANLIESANLIPGDMASVMFNSPPNSNSYNVSQFSLLRYKGEQLPNDLNYQMYTFDFIGPIYYQDRQQTVLDGSFQNMTGSDAIQKLWNQYLSKDSLTLQTTSSGMIGTTNQPFNTPGMKPLTAIYSIMKTLIGSQYANTGNWMLYRDNRGVNLAQLEQLLTNVGSQGSVVSGSYGPNGQQEYYVQKATWGVNFNDPDLYHAVIVAQMETRGSAVDVSGATQMKQFTHDIGTGNIIPGSMTPITGASVSGFGALFSGISGAVGPIGSAVGSAIMAGMQITDSSRWANQTAPYNKTPLEKSFSADAKSGPMLTLKVPLQTGLNATVGKGIYAYLMPPSGQVQGYNISNYSLSGPWLVVELVHELFSDPKREDQGTTVMKCMKGSIGGPGLGV